MVDWRSSQRGQKSKADKAAVLEDYRAGVKVADIVAKHGCSSTTIAKWAREAGISRHKPHASTSHKGTSSKHELTDGEWVTGPDRVARWIPLQKENR